MSTQVNYQFYVPLVCPVVANWRAWGPNSYFFFTNYRQAFDRDLTWCFKWACLVRNHLFSLVLKTPKLYWSGNTLAGKTFHSLTNSERRRCVEEDILQGCSIPGLRSVVRWRVSWFQSWSKKYFFLAVLMIIVMSIFLRD